MKHADDDAVHNDDDAHPHVMTNDNEDHVSFTFTLPEWLLRTQRPYPGLHM